MRVTICGFLTDYKSRLLLQRTAASSLAPISRSLEPGILPADVLARAFREDTSLVVLPVRLTGLYYAGQAGGELTFAFRCTMRGGELAIPEGRAPAGFFDHSPLPHGLARAYGRQAGDALHHAGGLPVMGREEAGFGARLGRLLHGDDPAPWLNTSWEVRVVVAAALGDQFVWTRSHPEETWRLPSAAPSPGEAPWQAAGRLLTEMLDSAFDLKGLAAFYQATERRAITLIFGATLRDAPSPARTLRLGALGDGSGAYDELSLAQAADSAEPTVTVFRFDSR